MPPPSSENDLKRRARRRLIGAVAVILLAVIVLPLLLEDEPPPASSLAVRMAVAPMRVPEVLEQPDQADTDVADVVQASPAPSHAALQPAPQAEPVKPEPKLKPESTKPILKPEHAKPTSPPHSVQAAKTPVSQAKLAASSEVFVVQLAALSDSSKAQALKARAAQAGLPAYTDSFGTLTRVRVGPYSSREVAVAAMAKLAANGLTGGQVLVK